MTTLVRNPPFAFQCAWQVRWTADYSTITYNRLTFDSMSGGSNHNSSGGMDITTGLFTVGPGFSGVWTITYTISLMLYRHRSRHPSRAIL